MTSPPPVTPALHDSSHTVFDDEAFWRLLPGYASVDEDTFMDHAWQARNSVTRVGQLADVVGDRVPASFLEDVAGGLQKAPMSFRVSPYIIGLIDWTQPYEDPLRAQFIPVKSRLLPDHPQTTLDPLHELENMVVPGLTHRYRDRALLLALDACPVYCRFCTRSYSVGASTATVEKIHVRGGSARWTAALSYIASQPHVEDVVVSGGDAYMLKSSQISDLGHALLDIEHVRRIRYATKGPCVIPQKLITDTEWLEALCSVVERGKRLRKEVALHTHFNHPREITSITKSAMGLLMERGVTVRNQSVLQRGVNDDPATMVALVKRLSYLNVHPYYVYMHDLTKGVEDLRTSLWTGIEIEKHVRGATAGFNTPAFVVDAPGGGGKRDVHSFDHYDPSTGISVFSSPTVSPGKSYFYFDPLHSLPGESAQRWCDPEQRRHMLDEATAAARRRRGQTTSCEANESIANAASRQARVHRPY